MMLAKTPCRPFSLSTCRVTQMRSRVLRSSTCATHVTAAPFHQTCQLTTVTLSSRRPCNRPETPKYKALLEDNLQPSGIRGYCRRAGWGRGRLISWHKPDCTWVRSKADPEKTPRDRECPACQEEEKFPSEYSPRELLFQRHLSNLRRALDYDPYETLFGWSNRARAGRLGRSLISENIRHESEKSSPRNAKEPAQKQDGRSTQETANAPSRDGPADEGAHSGSARPKEVSQSGKVDEKKADEKPTAQPTRLNHTLPNQARANCVFWKRTSINSSGERFESSGEMEFDPITMRMVSKESSSLPENPQKQQNFEGTTQHDKTGANESNPPFEKTPMQGSDPPKARKIPINSHDTISSAQIEVNQSKKQELEQSWARDKRPNKSPDRPIQNTSATPSGDPKTAQDVNTFQEPEPRPEKPIPSEQYPPQEEHMKRRRNSLINSMLKKKVPLKHMDAHEFHNHKNALLKNWSKGPRKPQPATKADHKLAEEVQSQKAAMNAFESRHSQKYENDLQYLEASGMSSKSSTDPTPVEAIVGEGDVSHDVGKFSNNDKWYKKKAPHASAAEKQERQDQELAKTVREIYEDAYGAIEPGHHQGPMLKTDAKAAIASALLHDLGDADHTRFAKFLKSNSISSTVPRDKDDQDSPNTQEPSSDTTTKVAGSNIHNVIRIGPISGLHFYVYIGGGDASTYARTIRGQNLNELRQAPRMPLLKALSQLSQPDLYIKRLVEIEKDQDVVLARDNVLVTRESSSGSKTNLHAEETEKQQVDGPTEQSNKGFHVPPQADASAEKAGFVDEYKFASENPGERTAANLQTPINGPRSKNRRRVRKEEDVFSGAFPKQKFTVPEIIEILNDRGLVEGRTFPSATPKPEGSSSINSEAQGKAGDEGKKTQDTRTRPSFSWIVTIAGASAVCCYVTGVVVENLRHLDGDDEYDE